VHKYHICLTCLKLRIISRLNLLVSQPFLYICVGQYTIVMVEVTTQEYNYNISYTVCLQYFLYRCINMPPQIEDEGSARNLKWKVVKKVVGSGLVKTSASLSWKEIKWIWISFFTTLSQTKHEGYLNHLLVRFQVRIWLHE
jgi:hypothetical protein